MITRDRISTRDQLREILNKFISDRLDCDPQSDSMIITGYAAIRDKAIETLFYLAPDGVPEPSWISIEDKFEDVIPDVIPKGVLMRWEFSKRIDEYTISSATYTLMVFRETDNPEAYGVFASVYMAHEVVDLYKLSEIDSRTEIDISHSDRGEVRVAKRGLISGMLSDMRKLSNSPDWKLETLEM